VIAWVVEATLVDQCTPVVGTRDDAEAEWAKKVGEPRAIIGDDQHSTVLVRK
jgi:hypothetical protein